MDYNKRLEISIHALRGEGDVRHRRQVEFCRLFQSTPSVGRATSPADVFFSRRTFQSTPSVGRATRKNSNSDKEERFQSTPSVGRATRCESKRFIIYFISIHALRGEGDIKQSL